MEKDGEMTLNKKIMDNDEFVGDGVYPDGVESQIGQAYLQKKSKYQEFNDPYVSDSQNSINVMLDPGVDSEAN